MLQAEAGGAARAATGVILGAVYMLYLYRRVIFGKLTKDGLLRLRDLSPREIAVFAPLIVLVFWMGIYPAPFLKMMHASSASLVRHMDAARATAAVPPIPIAAEPAPAIPAPASPPAPEPTAPNEKGS